MFQDGIGVMVYVFLRDIVRAWHLSVIVCIAPTSNGEINRELKHVTFLSHGRTPEVYYFPILLVFTLPHLYF